MGADRNSHSYADMGNKHYNNGPLHTSDDENRYGEPVDQMPMYLALVYRERCITLNEGAPHYG